MLTIGYVQRSCSSLYRLLRFTNRPTVRLNYIALHITQNANQTKRLMETKLKRQEGWLSPTERASVG